MSEHTPGSRYMAGTALHSAMWKVVRRLRENEQVFSKSGRDLFGQIDIFAGSVPR
jgi:hypothetical protein